MNQNDSLQAQIQSFSLFLWSTLNHENNRAVQNEYWTDRQPTTAPAKGGESDFPHYNSICLANSRRALFFVSFLHRSRYLLWCSGLNTGCRRRILWFFALFCYFLGSSLPPFSNPLCHSRFTWASRVIYRFRVPSVNFLLFAIFSLPTSNLVIKILDTFCTFTRYVISPK